MVAGLISPQVGRIIDRTAAGRVAGELVVLCRPA